MGIKQKSVGTSVTQNEFESPSSHVMDTPGIPYATSTTDIATASLGAVNSFLQINSSSVPQYILSPTLDGNLDVNGKILNNTGELSGKVSYGGLYINGGTEGTTSCTPIIFRTGNAASPAVITQRLNLGADSNIVTLTFSDCDIASDTATGLKIATTSTQRLGFFGTTPTIQLAHVTSTAVASTLAISILNALESIGLFKPA